MRQRHVAQIRLLREQLPSDTFPKETHSTSSFVPCKYNYEATLMLVRSCLVLRFEHKLMSPLLSIFHPTYPAATSFGNCNRLFGSTFPASNASSSLGIVNAFNFAPHWAESVPFGCEPSYSANETFPNQFLNPK